MQRDDTRLGRNISQTCSSNTEYASWEREIEREYSRSKLTLWSSSPLSLSLLSLILSTASWDRDTRTYKIEWLTLKSFPALTRADSGAANEYKVASNRTQRTDCRTQSGLKTSTLSTRVGGHEMRQSATPASWTHTRAATLSRRSRQHLEFGEFRRTETLAAPSE